VTARTIRNDVSKRERVSRSASEQVFVAEPVFAVELVKFVFGKRPLSENGAFLKTPEETFKYTLYTESAEKRLKEQGLLK
jgi:hypothetical protein